MVYDPDDPAAECGTGILTGVILSIGRIVGESAALLFTAGSGFQLPKNLFGKLFESSGTLTIQLLPVDAESKITISVWNRGRASDYRAGNQPADEIFDQPV